MIPMNVNATGWVSATVVTDKQTYKTGETVTITVTGVDSDANANDNWINITVKDPQMNVFYSRTRANPGAAGPYVRSVYIPTTAQTGYYTIEINDYTTGALIGTGAFTVIPSGSNTLTLVPSKYTKTTVYVPGETIQADVIASPGAQCSIEVTFGTQSLRKDTVTTDSMGMATYQYALDQNAPDGPSPTGENYAMTLTLCGSDYDMFGVRLYGMDIGTERTAFMPGEEIVAHYMVTQLDTGKKAPDGLVGTWRLTDLTFKEAARGSFSTSLGDIKTSAPTTVGSYYLMAWYNTTDGKRTAEGYVPQPLAVSDMRGMLMSPADGSTVQPGAGITVDMLVYVGTNTALPGIDVAVVVYRSGSPVSNYGKTGMVTGSDGHAGYAFRVDPTEADGTMLRIEAKASKGTTSVTDIHQIRVTTKSSSTFIVWLETDKSEYFSGDTVKFTVKGSVDASPSSFNYQYTIRSGIEVLMYAASNSQSLEFKTSETFEGTLTCDVVVYDQTGNNTAATISVSVKFAYLLVNANILQYNPGDIVTFSYSFSSAKSVSPEFFYDVKDASGIVKESNALTASSFSYKIPDAPSSSYTATVYASFTGHMVSGAMQVTKLGGFAFRVSISTPQPYANGYVPGQSIRLHYQVVALGKDILPGKFQITYGTYGENDARQVLTSSAEGELDYAVPSGTDDSVMVTLTVKIDTRSAYSIVMVPVTANPSVLDMRAVGLVTVGDMLLGILILLIVIALLVIKREWIRTRVLKKQPKSPPAPQPMHYQPIPAQVPPPQPVQAVHQVGVPPPPPPPPPPPRP
jgi:hypothetical protein